MLYFHFTVSLDVLFCTNLLLHKIHSTQLFEMLLILSFGQFWFHLSSLLLYCTTTNLAYILYYCSKHRFTSGVIKRIVRSQTNNIFLVNTKLNCAIHSLYSILHRLFWRQGCNQTLLIDVGTSPLKLLIH